MILIAGGPRCGKTSLANHLAAARGEKAHHTDDLVGSLDWSACSAKAAEWIDQKTGVIEGVAMGRALRKWLAAHAEDDAKPCDILYWCGRPKVELTPGQMAMHKGCATVMAGILPELQRRGVIVRELP
jgi:hypothetical protein